MGERIRMLSVPHQLSALREFSRNSRLGSGSVYKRYNLEIPGIRRHEYKHFCFNNYLNNM